MIIKSGRIKFKLPKKNNNNYYKFEIKLKLFNSLHIFYYN